MLLFLQKEEKEASPTKIMIHIREKSTSSSSKKTGEKGNHKEIDISFCQFSYSKRRRKNDTQKETQEF
jgi:hypothetical protein